MIMEVIKNETIEEKQEPQKMSEFCEAVMDATENLKQLATENGGAILLYSDSDRVAMRIHGSRDVVANALYSVMKNNLDFAELIVETSMKYAHHMLGVRVVKKMDNSN